MKIFNEWGVYIEFYHRILRVCQKETKTKLRWKIEHIKSLANFSMYNSKSLWLAENNSIWKQEQLQPSQSVILFSSSRWSRRNDWIALKFFKKMEKMWYVFEWCVSLTDALVKSKVIVTRKKLCKAQWNHSKCHEYNLRIRNSIKTK